MADPFSILCGVAGLASLAQVVVEKGYFYINTAKDYRQELKDLMAEVAGLFGVLTALRSVVDRLDNTSHGQNVTQHQQILDCEKVLKKVEDYLQESTPGDKTRPKKLIGKLGNFGKSTLWPLRKQETMDLINSLERHKNTFILTLSADTTAKVIELLNEINISNHHLLDVRREQTKVAEEKIEEDRRAKLRWLFPGDTDEKHKDIRQKRHEDTGNWFFLTEEFKSWCRQPGWLFCHGKPGAGKTVLTSIVLDHIIAKFPDEDVGIAHIYCGYKDRDDQTPTKIFASILQQLSYRKPNLPPEVESLYEEFTKKGKTPDLTKLVEATISVARRFSRVWLFVDALDECDETQQRNDLLPNIKHLMKTNINGFITSRSHALDIQRTFEEATRIVLSANEVDIEMLVRSRLSAYRRLKIELVEDIVSQVLAKAEGMFLLVAFQLDYILKQPSAREMREALGRLPTGIHETYNHIIEKINQLDHGNKELALKALTWISRATRPLHPRELREAVAIREGDETIEDDFLTEVGTIVDVCGGLVTIDENSQTVRFIHYSVQEHFNENPHILPGTHAMMARICLTYLSFEEFDECPDDGMNTQWLAKRVEENAFYDYAARNWGYHTKFSEEEDSVLELACKFSELGNRMESAIHLFRTKTFPTDPSPLASHSRNTFSVAAEVGLPQLTRLLMQLDILMVDLKENEYYERTPLSLAAENGHVEIVQLLVDRDDVKVDSKDKFGQTPLSLAAEFGREAVVELLVNRGDVEADSKDKHGQTPLSLAAKYGDEAIVHLLVDRDDVDTDSKDVSDRTPLSWAAQFGEEAIVKLLIDRDEVKADSKDIYDRTPLSWAAQFGEKTIVQLLVDRDDVKADSKDIYDRTPLSWAAQFGKETVVQLLVDRDDVEADSKDECGGTPLAWAAEYGKEAIVQLLVDRDDVAADSKDVCSRTPLSWAAMEGHEAVVQLLVGRDDVEVNSKDTRGGTPLSWAAANGHEAIVQLLVDRDGVEVDLKDNYGRTALCWAAIKGHEAIVQLLMDRDEVDVNGKDTNGLTPLSWAAWQGHETVVQILRDKENAGATKLTKHGSEVA